MMMCTRLIPLVFLLLLGSFTATASGQATPPVTAPAPVVAPQTPPPDATTATDGADAADGTVAPGATNPALATDPEPVETTAFDELMIKIQAGGYIGYLLIGLSIIGFSFVIERIFHLRRNTICPDGFAPRLLAQLKAHQYEAALKTCQQNPSVLARVLASVVRHRRFSFSEISLVAGDEATREMRHQMQMAYPLAIVATLSPLLGLLGTVIGMIGAFEAVALHGSMGDPSVMAEDISFALVTTAMGLIIAVPALGAFHILRTRTTLLTTRLESHVSETISEWRIAVLEETHQADQGNQAAPVRIKGATTTDITPNAPLNSGDVRPGDREGR